MGGCKKSQPDILQVSQAVGCMAILTFSKCHRLKSWINGQSDIQQVHMSQAERAAKEQCMLMHASRKSHMQACIYIIYAAGQHLQVSQLIQAQESWLTGALEQPTYHKRGLVKPT